MEILVGLLPYIQIALAVLLMVTVLLQQTAASMGGAFGADNFSAGFHTRRGFEKFLFRATMTIAILFVFSALAGLLLA